MIGKITSQVMTITPALAAEYLERNTRNRPLRKRHVRNMAAQMKSGQWVIAQPIIFSHEGVLIDGQHRLQAVILSGVSVQMLVVHGVSEGAFGVIDQGPNRSASDLHALLGGSNSVKHTSCAAAMYLGLMTTTSVANVGGTRQDIAEYAMKHSESIARVIAALSKQRYCTSPIIAAFAVAGEKYGWDKIDPMLVAIGSRSFSGEDDPMNRLTGWCINHCGRGNSGSSSMITRRHVVYGAAVCAIRAALQNRTLKGIKPSETDFE